MKAHDPMRPLDVLNKVGDYIDVAGQGICKVVEVEPRRMLLRRHNGNLLEVTIGQNERVAHLSDQPVLREMNDA
ncbi:MAG: hypothetical protein ACYSW8_32740 [Planctomycetota bacterium]|jgi:hypothetical protein